MLTSGQLQVESVDDDQMLASSLLLTSSYGCQALIFIGEDDEIYAGLESLILQ